MARSSSSLLLSPTDNRDWLPKQLFRGDDKPSTRLDDRFSRDICRLLALLLLVGANCVSNAEVIELRLDGIIAVTIPPPPLLKVFDVLWECAAERLPPFVEFFGVGGNGEFACRFSGLGDPRLPTELVHDEEEAKGIYIYIYIIPNHSRILLYSIPCLECTVRKLST